MPVMETVSTSEIERLREALSKFALRIAPEGQPFTLASGRESRIYFDVKQVTLAPEVFLTIGELVREQCYAYGATAVGGLAAGAIPIAMAVVAREAMEGSTKVRSFYVRDKKTHGIKESLYQAFDEGHPSGIISAESTAVVVDDVLTTGNSIGEATREILSRGARVSAIVVLVDRGEGGAQALRKEFRVPVVAIFRMDDRGNLSFLGGEVY
ncbi:MAG: phosphoribosyltransferase family protein [Dehalococcoidia bacterium]